MILSLGSFDNPNIVLHTNYTIHKTFLLYATTPSRVLKPERRHSVYAGSGTLLSSARGLPRFGVPSEFQLTACTIVYLAPSHVPIGREIVSNSVECVKARRERERDSDTMRDNKKDTKIKMQKERRRREN
jgi:hypothetical protein